MLPYDGPQLSYFKTPTFEGNSRSRDTFQRLLSHQTDPSYGRVESSNGKMERTLLETLDLHKFPRPNMVQKSANYEESRPREKIINTAFAPHFTWGCKFEGECGIYHLCPRPWFLVVSTFPCSERHKISNLIKVFYSLFDRRLDTRIFDVGTTSFRRTRPTSQRGPPGSWGEPLFSENFHETDAKRSSYFSTEFSEYFGIIEIQSGFEEVLSGSYFPVFCDGSENGAYGCLKKTPVKSIN